MIKKIILVLLLSLILIVCVLTLNHYRQSNFEARLYKPLEGYIQSEETMINFYSNESDGPNLIFLSGFGIASPVFDYMPLWRRLENEYNVIVIEREGYGWNENQSGLDYDNLIDEIRNTLKHNKIEPPYYLIGHSLGAIHAMDWATDHSDEISMVIGIDPATIKSLETVKPPSKIALYGMSFGSLIGVSRLLSNERLSDLFPLLKSEDLSESEKKSYRTLIHRNLFTRQMLEEGQNIEKFVESFESKVSIEYDGIPHLFFIAENETNLDFNIINLNTDYLSRFEESEYYVLEGSHFLHYEKADFISEKIIYYIEKMK